MVGYIYIYIALLCTDACNIEEEKELSNHLRTRKIFLDPVMHRRCSKFVRNSKRRGENRCGRNIHGIYSSYARTFLAVVIGTHPHHLEKPPLLQMLGLNPSLRLSQLVILYDCRVVAGKNETRLEFRVSQRIHIRAWFRAVSF